MKKLLSIIIIVSLSIVTYGQVKPKANNQIKKEEQVKQVPKSKNKSSKIQKTQQQQKKIKKTQMQQRRATQATQRQRAIKRRKSHK